MLSIPIYRRDVPGCDTGARTDNVITHCVTPPSKAGPSDHDHKSLHPALPTGQGDPPVLKRVDGPAGPSEPLTWRDRLVQEMGLEFDPFRVGFAEREEEEQYFGEVYVNPPIRSSLAVDGQASLLARLLRSGHTFVFADPGHGKSATRLALEYSLRSAKAGAPTLAVRYTPNVRSEFEADQPKTADEHFVAIAGEMLVDLLIQSLERLQLRFHELDRLSDERRHLLLRLYRSSPGSLRRTIQAWAGSETPHSSLWGGLRSQVLIREVAPRWQAWLREFVAEARPLQPEAWSWQALAAAADTLGFSRVFLLIDAIDEETIDLLRHKAIVKPFVERLGELEDTNVFVKGFLPIGLEQTFQTEFQPALNGLTVPVELATIPKTTPAHLDAIINQRLGTAARGDASFKSLDWFCGPDVEESIQERLILLADGSPRRLITLISLLLDDHSTGGFQHDNQRLTLTSAEWQRFLDHAAGRIAPTPPERQ